MAKLQALKKDDEQRKEPVMLGDRAADNLKFIRETMERSTHFTAVPGYGGALMGVTAIVAAYIAMQQTTPESWLAVWLTEALLALAIGVLGMWQKSKLGESSLLSAPAKKFAFGFAPSIICGAAMTFGLWRYGQYELMPAAWMMLYGASVVTGGAFSVRIVPVMGWIFMAIGAVTLLLPATFGNYMMAASFGLTHIVFGLIIGRRFGG